MRYLFIAIIIIASQANAKPDNKKEPSERILILGQKTPYPYIDTDYNFNFKSQFLKENNLDHSEDVWKLVPNINTAGGTNRIKYIQIRGIGERSQYENTPDSSVGVFLDHIDFSNSLSLIGTHNLESINIYKGPQSFIYGSDALAGNIILKTITPNTINKELSFNTNVSDFNKKDISTRFASPVSDDFAINISLRHLKSEGFIRNTFLDENTNSNQETYLSFNSLYLKNSFELRTNHHFIDQKNGYDVWSFTPHTYKTLSDKPGQDNQQSHGHSVEANLITSKNSTLSLISSIMLSDILYSYDEDWGNNPYWNSIPGYNADYDYNKSYKRNNSKIHQKIIYQSSLKSNLKITSGLHYSRNEEDSNILSFKDSSLRDSLQSNFLNEQISLFFGLKKNYKKLNLSLNTRLQRVFLSFQTDSNFKSESSESLTGFNLKAQYKLNSQNDLNFVLSKGFKTGGFNPDTSLSNNRQVYQSENLFNYELKYTYQPLDLFLSLFFMDRRDQQITTSFQDDPMDPSSFGLYIDNAAKSSNYGLELGISLFRHKYITSSLNLGLLKAKFIKYEREGVSYNNREQAHAPTYNFSILNKAKLSKGLDLVLNISGKDSFYFSNGHNQLSKPYTLVDLNLNYQINKQSKISLWSKNLFNKDYAQRGFYFANEPPLWQEKLYIQSGPPREVGLSFSYNLD